MMSFKNIMELLCHEVPRDTKIFATDPGFKCWDGKTSLKISHIITNSSEIGNTNSEV